MAAVLRLIFCSLLRTVILGLHGALDLRLCLWVRTLLLLTCCSLDSGYPISSRTGCCRMFVAASKRYRRRLCHCCLYRTGVSSDWPLLLLCPMFYTPALQSSRSDIHLNLMCQPADGLTNIPYWGMRSLVSCVASRKQNKVPECCGRGRSRASQGVSASHGESINQSSNDTVLAVTDLDILGEKDQ